VRSCKLLGGEVQAVRRFRIEQMELKTLVRSQIQDLDFGLEAVHARLHPGPLLDMVVVHVASPLKTNTQPHLVANGFYAIYGCQTPVQPRSGISGAGSGLVCPKGHGCFIPVLAQQKVNVLRCKLAGFGEKPGRLCAGDITRRKQVPEIRR